jgi:hypothetical protein
LEFTPLNLQIRVLRVEVTGHCDEVVFASLDLNDSFA